VTLQNPSRALAFFVHLKVSKSTQVPTEAAEESEILPMLWEDNYFPLMPGEKRAITATYRAKDLGKAMPLVDVDGWNVRHRRL
jgi:exo-1,4-beta-D-glucosaminidase